MQGLEYVPDFVGFCSYSELFIEAQLTAEQEKHLREHDDPEDEVSHVQLHCGAGDVAGRSGRTCSIVIVGAVELGVGNILHFLGVIIPAGEVIMGHVDIYWTFDI